MNDSVNTPLNLSLRLWLRLLHCAKLIENEIRGNLRECFHTTLPRFDVMAQLYRYPDGLRLGELSQQLMVTGGNITGIIDQLAQEGLVARTPDPTDRRAYVAKLTPTGTATFAAMAAQHREWIVALTSGLSDDDQQQLQALLTKLRDSIQERLSQK